MYLQNGCKDFDINVSFLCLKKSLFLGLIEHVFS
jgi:hypothetical protein